MRTILNINKDWSFVKNFAEVPAEIPAEAEKISIVEEESIDAYVLCLDESAQLEAFKVVTMLRSHGFVSETDYLQRKFKAQFKSVERMKAKVAILIGAKEVENKQVTIKKIDTQEQGLG